VNLDIWAKDESKKAVICIVKQVQHHIYKMV